MVFFSIENSTPKQKKECCDRVLLSLKSIKNEIPYSAFLEMRSLLTVFLKENVIFHPDLTQYIDETETYTSKPTSLKNSEIAMITVNSARNADELAEALYHMSEYARENAYDIFPSNIASMITNVDEIAHIIRFLPPKHIEKVLKKSEIQALIKNENDLDAITRQLFRPEQVAATLKVMKHRCKNINPERDHTVIPDERMIDKQGDFKSKFKKLIESSSEVEAAADKPKTNDPTHKI